MPDFPSPDDAALYVLGGLTVAERQAFESRLAESAELRVLVRELEEGALAVALASPERQPPQKVWKQIERTVAKETNRAGIIPVFWSALWRNGWAAAAACLAGWLFYAFSIQAPVSHTISDSKMPSSEEVRVVDSHTQLHNVDRHPSLVETNKMRQLLAIREQEIGGLRQHVAGLENRLASLSQSLAQQQMLLGESNRLKFFQLVPATNPDAASGKAILSPALQRAVYLAMARELGWLSSTNTTPDIPGVIASEDLQTNQLGVDFVDFRTTTNTVTTSPESQPKAQTEMAAVQEPPPTNSPASTIIPAFVSGEDLVVAIDSSITSPDGQVTFLSGDQLTFWNGAVWNENGSQLPIGSATLGNNPLVVTLPTSAFSTHSLNGSTLIISARSASGQSSTLYFSVPVTPKP